MNKYTLKIATALLIILPLVLVFGAVRPYVPLSLDVTSSSTLIMKDSEDGTSAGINAADQWLTATVYALGDVVQNTVSGQKRSYWCIKAGTSTGGTGPTVLDGDDTSDAAVSWRRIRGSRTQFVIQNDGADDMYLAFGSAAIVNKGIRVNANGGTYVSPAGNNCFQGDVFAISAGGTINSLQQAF